MAHPPSGVEPQICCPQPGAAWLHYWRIRREFLPGDVSSDGLVQPLDLLRFRQLLYGTLPDPPAQGVLEDYYDIDRNGEIKILDLLRWRQLWFGTGMATRPWGVTIPPGGESLDAMPACDGQ